MITEKHVNIAAKMYDAREKVIALIGREKFQEKVTLFRPKLEEMARDRGGNVVKAAMDLVAAMQNRGENEVIQMLILAACVEIIEPYTRE